MTREETQKKIWTRPHKDESYRRKVRTLKIMLSPITVPLYAIFIAYEWFHNKISNTIVIKGKYFFDWYISR